MAAPETLTCTRCSMDWTRERKRGRKPPLCPACRTVARAPRPARPARLAQRRAPNGINSEHPGYRLAHAVTAYRLAIEEATGALRLNRPAEALAALQRVQAPGRLKG